MLNNVVRLHIEIRQQIYTNLNISILIDMLFSEVIAADPLLQQPRYIQLAFATALANRACLLMAREST